MTDDAADNDTLLKLGCGAALVPLFPVFLLAVSLPHDLIVGYVLWHLWGWFAVPAGAAAVSYPNAVGLLLIAQCLRPVVAQTTPKRTKIEIAATFIASWVVVPLLLLSVGWGIHTYWMSVQ